MPYPVLQAVPAKIPFTMIASGARLCSDAGPVLAFRLAGVFTVILRLLHFFFPSLLDFRQAIPLEGASLKPLRLLLYRYATKRSDVHGIAWIMNHCVRSRSPSLTRSQPIGWALTPAALSRSGSPAGGFSEPAVSFTWGTDAGIGWFLPGSACRGSCMSWQ